MVRNLVVTSRYGALRGSVAEYQPSGGDDARLQCCIGLGLEIAI